jgi:hypothetical protein
MREWHAVFSSPDANLQAIGISAATGSNTPHHVARTLVQLRAALEDERAKHAPADGRHSHEVSELRAALRDTGRVGREQAAYEIAALQTSARAAVDEERVRRQAAEVALRKCQAGVAAAVAEQVEEQVNAVRVQANADAAEAASAHASTVGALQAELQLALRRAGALEAESAAQRRAAQRQQEDDSAAIAALKAELSKSRTDAETEANALRNQLAEQDAAWSKALEDRDAAWRASDSVVRATAQDERIAFLTRRLEELERLAEAMQQALCGESNKIAETKPQRTWCGGGVTAHTSGNPAALLAAGSSAAKSPATARHRGDIDILARVRHSGTSAAGGRAVQETQYYAVVA